MVKQIKQAGFTLLELLTVISIMSLIANSTFAVYTTTNFKARDTVRRHDLALLRDALERYAIDNNETYPSTGGLWHGQCSGYGPRTADCDTGGVIPNIPFIVGLCPTYITSLPFDPSADDQGGDCYLYRSDGTNYKLLAHQTMEISSCPPMPDNDPMWDNRSLGQCTIGISTPGIAVSW